MITTSLTINITTSMITTSITINIITITIIFVVIIVTGYSSKGGTNPISFFFFCILIQYLSSLSIEIPGILSRQTAETNSCGYISLLHMYVCIYIYIYKIRHTNLSLSLSLHIYIYIYYYYYYYYHYCHWIFIKGGCSGRGVQPMGVVSYNNNNKHNNITTPIITIIITMSYY